MFHMAMRAIENFWQQHPALLYGIAFLLGTYAQQSWHPILILPAAGLLFPLIFWRWVGKHQLSRLLLAIAFFLCAYIYSEVVIIYPDVNTEDEIAGIARFSPSRVRATMHHGINWQYSGTACIFDKNKKLIAKNIPCQMRLNDKLLRPLGNQCYQFSATLNEQGSKKYVLVPDKETPWQVVPLTWSAAELRLAAQKKLSSYIKSEIKNTHSANFLVGIITGDFQDRLLSYEFSRFGLQHIMAISGFHFAILASLLSLLFSFIFPARMATVLLIICLCGYFLFLDASSPIMRAWMCCMLALIGSLIGCKASGLNSLGIALLVIIIIEPSAPNSLGFQFSFATTASILLLFPLCDSLLQKIFPKRKLYQAVEMDDITQHAYVLLCLFRQALALDIAVNLIALPLTLFYFHKFPLLSLAYNLFFPFLVSISILLLLLSLGFWAFFPWLSSAINALNDSFTSFTLEYTYNMPSSFDMLFFSPNFPMEIIVVQSFILFFGSIIYRHYLVSRKQNFTEWSFI